MPLIAGRRLGPYEIVSPLGAGGMGEVYRARDTRLGREVAVKVLPQELTASPEVRARFEREAKTISSLNHPHICTLHDIGREGDVDYLVMELIEGQTLAERLANGPLPVADVLKYGIQISEALDRAHRAGVIHRDLKPGNVMIARGEIKLMDFGLARNAVGGGASGRSSGVSVATLSQSPTIGQPLTVEGTIIGTFQYLSPEQLEGSEADARSDIWALGCVLHEMAAGRPAFGGKSQASLISAIMSSEPQPISQIAPMIPPALDRVVRGCLAKDPEERVQTVHDVKLQLEWIAEGGSQAGVPAPVAARRRTRERLAWTLVAAATVIAAVFGALLLRPKPPAKPVIFELTPPAQVGFVDLPRISPDGRMLAFNAGDSTGTTGIWVRHMNSLRALRLQGTDGATRPFWSPDSRYLAFFTGGKLYKIDVGGGPPLAICDAPRGADGSWGKNGVILFDGTTADSVQRVPAAGGIPVGVAPLDRAAGETFSAWPQFLPDGKHYLFLAYGPGETRTLKLGSLDSDKLKSLGPAISRVEYAAGHLLFVRLGTLIAQPFDTQSLKLHGDPLPVAENVEFDGTGGARFSASNEGTLVYRSGGSAADMRLQWLDRTGKKIGTVGGPGIYINPALSPDESQLAVAVVDVARGNSDIWIWDLTRDLGSRITFEKTDTFDPVWMPDGHRLLFSVDHATGADLFVKPVGSSGASVLFYHSPDLKSANNWTPDGRTLLMISRSTAQTRRFDIGRITLGDSTRYEPIVATEFSEYGPTASPDGRLFAYVSWESGKEEVYVQTLAGPSGKWRISTEGGREPAWRADGRELFYIGPARKMFSVQVEPGPTPKFSLPEKLFDAPDMISNINMRNRYVVTRDGGRFLVVSRQGVARLGATTVLLDWVHAREKP